MTVTEREQKINQKINDEKVKSTERVYRLIEKEEDMEKLAAAVNEEKANLKTRIDQLKAQKRAIDAREKNLERKQRTRRLIQHGALAEKYLNCIGTDTASFEELLKQIVAKSSTKLE